MKSKADVAENTFPAEPIERNTPPEEQDRKLPVESKEFSPEGITTRALATTQILHDILEQEVKSYYVHHWGINE